MKFSTMFRRNLKTKNLPQPLQKPATPVAPARHPSAIIAASQGPDMALLQFYVEALAHVLKEAEITCRIVKWFVSPRFMSLGVNLKNPTQFKKATDNSLLNAIAHKAGVKHVLVEHRAIKMNNGTSLGVLLYQMPIPDAPSPVWGDKDVVGTCIGIGANGEPIQIKEDDWERGHVLVGGSTGSGKSVLVRDILYALATNYTPEELRIAVIDPHGDHFHWENEEHMLGPIAENQLQVASTLSFVAKEAQRRVQSRDWIKCPEKLARWVIVIDEADGAEAFPDSVPDLLKYGQIIASDGRKAKVHMVLATHRPSYAKLQHVVDACTVKYLGMVSSSQLSGQFGAGLNLTWLMGKGDYLRVQGDDKQRFQTVFTTERRVRALPRHKTPLKPLPLPTTPIVSKAGVLAFRQSVADSPLRQLEPRVVGFILKQGTSNVTAKTVSTALNIPLPKAQVNYAFSKGVETGYRSYQ